MASNFACLGLGDLDQDGLERLLRQVMPAAVPLGEADGVTLLRWSDPSGVRPTLALKRGKVIDLLPSFAGEPARHCATSSG